MFIQMSYIQKKLRSLSLKLFHTIENNGNANFNSNGEKIFIDNVMDSFSERKGMKIIFDIGANIGEYSQMIKNRARDMTIQIHLFEPTKSCFDELSKKFKNDNSLYLNNFGVSNENTQATIFYDKEKSGLASLYQRNLDAYHLVLNQHEEIALKRLDNYIEEQNIQHIELVKIDIEGHELKAFEGLGKYLDSSFIDYIQFEYGGANLDSNTSLMEIYELLNDRGFQVAKVMTNGLEIRGYKPFMDNFQYSNYVAFSNTVAKNK